MNKTVALIQARFSSTRLPGKVLKHVFNKPMLLQQIERVSRSKSIDHICVVTSSDYTDYQLVEVLIREDIEYYRGSLDDVLDRFYQAAVTFQADNIVRLTGDCPLIDPLLIDEVVQLHLHGGFDYSSNVLSPTFPDGLDVEVVSFPALEKTWKEAKLLSEREHVTPYIYDHNELFSLGSYQSKENLSHFRWTVDEPEDFELICEIYDNLYPINPDFTTDDILNFLDHNPQLIKINNNILRNEGLAKSRTKDQVVIR